jgi:nucleotide-binding universal stress UspA family protein
MSTGHPRPIAAHAAAPAVSVPETWPGSGDAPQDGVLLHHAFHEATVRNASLSVQDHVAPGQSAHPTIDVRAEVPHIRPVDALEHASAHSDLLLVGRRRGHGLVHLGSVVRTLISESRCPVGVVGSPEATPTGSPELNAVSTA